MKSNAGVFVFQYRFFGTSYFRRLSVVLSKMLKAMICIIKLLCRLIDVTFKVRRFQSSGGLRKLDGIKNGYRVPRHLGLIYTLSN
jgi:hypothetical protein